MMKANRTLWAKGVMIILLIATVSATHFLATAEARVMIMEAVGLTGAHDASCAGNSAEAPAKSNVACDDSPKPVARQLPQPGRERPLQFNFRRY